MPNKRLPHPPSNGFTRRLSAFARASDRALLTQGLRGIEKESLRILPDGQLALTPHAPAFGSALTHPKLTTDYSEALLEIITPAEQDVALTLEQLDTLHRFVYAELKDELLWNQSMPCPLPAEEDIPLARYGTSNIGRLKHVYRRGLALRYGRTMQCIAGVHYNYSLPEGVWRVLQQAQGDTGSPVDFQSESYIALIRNFRRTNWLLMYLFGASPVLDKQFLRGRAHTLEVLDDDTLYLPYATSLRMSDLGYQNNAAQATLSPSYDDLGSYLESLAHAVSQPYPPYEAMGTQRDGEWIQINTNVLQIENEFYSTIRPKRITYPGERPLQALSERGVQYIEVRCLDIDPFEPVGIALPTARLLDAYLLYCALEDSPRLSADARAEAGENFAHVVKQGRRPGLALSRDGQSVPLAEWAGELLDRIAPAAALLDELQGGDAHASALHAQRAKLADAELTPSARVLASLRESGRTFTRHGLQESARHAAYFRARPLPPEQHAELAALARKSLDEQAEIERTEVGSFDAFVKAYRAYTLTRSAGVEKRATVHDV
jgi:glutamate--cysteine ligase